MADFALSWCDYKDSEVINWFFNGTKFATQTLDGDGWRIEVAEDSPFEQVTLNDASKPVVLIKSALPSYSGVFSCHGENMKSSQEYVVNGQWTTINAFLVVPNLILFMF